MVHLRTRDVNLDVTELAQHLSTHATWGGEPAVDLPGDYADRLKLLLALGHGFADGTTFGAQAHRVRGALDVATRVYATIVGQESCADREIAVGRVREGTSSVCFVYQFLLVRSLLIDKKKIK